jgi:hypothetical protein
MKGLRNIKLTLTSYSLDYQLYIYNILTLEQSIKF